VQYEMGRAKGDVITVLREGKPEFWKINDELLLRSITNMKPATAEGVLAAYGKITRFMAASVTSNNIIWSLFSNFPRDLGSMFTYSETKNPIRLFGGVASAYLNKVKGADASALYKEFLAMGGGQTSAYTYDVNLAKKIRRKIGDAKLHWLNPLEWLEFVSNTVEAGPRFACYKIMRENGMSPEGAFYASTEITVNFRRGGTMARQMNKLVPFFNAGVQGLDRFRRWVTAADVPASTRKKAVAMRSMMYLTASAAIAAMVSSLNLGDDERRKEYATLSAYTKNNFWCIPLGDGKYFTIPKPREVAVLSSFIEACLEKVLVDENAMSTGYDHAMDGFYEYAVNAFLPSVLSDIAQGDIWGALGSFGIGGTLAYMMANRDFLGKPIVSSALERYEPKDRYTDRTSRIAHAIGQAFNVSPAMVDYFFQQTLGGFWKSQRALFPVGDEHVDYTLGVLNTYVRDSLYSTDVINKMYDRMEKTEQAKNSDPENIKKAIAYKEALNMTTFYSRYNKLAKGKPEDRDTRRAVIHMAHEFNKAAESGRRTYEQRQLDSICASTGDTELMPSVLQDTVKDSDGREYKLNAAQYVRYQTEYNSLYWRNVSVVLDNYGDEAAVKTAKDQAQDEAKAKLLKRLGVTDKLTERFDSMAEAGVDTSEYIQFQAALSTAREDGTLAKAEVLDALDEMALDDKEREYLYDQQYSTAALTNPYRSYESLQEKINERRAEKADEGKDYTTIDRSIKSSLTNAYKDEVIRLYEAGDYEGIQEIIDKLSVLDLHTRKGGPYYTYNYVWSWIHAYYHIPGTGAIYK
jgi:hypothetical protein